MQKKKRSQVESAELRYQALLVKRNEFNDLAREHREARDLLNQEKKEKLEEINRLKEERTALVKQIRDHKVKRDACHQKFKELLQLKRSRKKAIYTSLPSEIEALKAEINDLDMKQQTIPLTIQEENELIDEIKHKISDMRVLEKRAGEQEVIKIEVGDMDRALTELREMAEQEHRCVVELSIKVREIIDRQDALFKESSHLIAEANKSHEALLSARERADHYHAKAVEMREKILAIKREMREDARAGKREVEEINRAVRRVLDDPQAMEKAAEHSLRELLKKGRVEIG
ncbi:MAG: hypothetical protein AB1665_08015 [Candidatus Thermoplasmatota archaeon]